MIGTIVASAVPVAAAPPRDVYDTGAFLDLGAFVATAGGGSGQDAYDSTVTNEGAPLVRVTIGVLVSKIAAGGNPSFHLRIGVSGYASNLQAQWYHGGEYGIGVDVTYDLPVTCYARVGGHVGAATASSNTTLLTLGPRVFFFERVWLGVDLYHFTNPVDSFSSITTGVLGGGGFTL